MLKTLTRVLIILVLIPVVFYGAIMAGRTYKNLVIDWQEPGIPDKVKSAILAQGGWKAFDLDCKKLMNAYTNIVTHHIPLDNGFLKAYPIIQSTKPWHINVKVATEEFKLVTISYKHRYASPRDRNTCYQIVVASRPLTQDEMSLFTTRLLKNANSLSSNIFEIKLR